MSHDNTPPIVKRGVCGLIRAEVLRGDLSVKSDTGWGPNLVTDRGLDYLHQSGSEGSPARPSQMFMTCQVGDGNTPPAPEDLGLSGTVLATLRTIASPTVAWVNDPVDGWYIRRRMTYEFPLGAVVGNVAEVCIGPGQTATYDAAIRALTTDLSGNPVVVPVLADEILRIHHEFRMYVDMDADDVYQVTIGPNVHDVTLRPSRLGHANSIMAGPQMVFNTAGASNPALGL